MGAFRSQSGRVRAMSQSRMSQSGRLKSSRTSHRMISDNTEVDETLFASGKQTQGSPSLQQQRIVRPKEQMANLLGSDSVVMSSSELSRLKEAATVITPQEAAAAAKVKADGKASTMAAARARKQKIISMEAERKKNEAKSDLEMEAIEKDKHQLSRADFLVDEQRDDVKRMNQFVRYAKCSTIRDAQLEEKKALQRQMEEEEMRLDEVMEQERTRAVELAS